MKKTKYEKQISITSRRQKLVKAPEGFNVWEVVELPEEFAAIQTALILCDVWNSHWCRTAVLRLEKLLPRMNQLATSLRNMGATIIHAPSDTLDFYKDHTARKRAVSAPFVKVPAELPHEDPLQPFEDIYGDGGCECYEKTGDKQPWDPPWPWRRQHQAIHIDDERDYILDDKQMLYNVYCQRGIKKIILMGVHANKCILNRSFAIKQMVKWGLDVTFVRDITDIMYNPANPPYVNHDEGTRLIVEYIEKFWCSTVSSEELLRNDE